MITQLRSWRPFGVLGSASLVLLIAVPLWPSDAKLGATDDKKAQASLPSGQDWVIHVYRDLMPYWQMDSAIGKPPGNVPSFRYYDGSVVTPGKLRDEYASLDPKADAWILNRIGRQYTRMMSRQGFGYCAAYHMTGDERFLELAKATVDYILKNAFDEQTGGFVAYFEDGKPSSVEATTQDLSFSLLAPSFYYYLTRDKEILDKLLKAKKFIFEKYMGKDGLIRWVNNEYNDPPDVNSPARIDLVSQLDQINAYLVLQARILPDEEWKQWRQDMIALSHVIQDRFYSDKYNLLWGRIDDPNTNMKLEAWHVDFGHTVKGFANLDMVARLTGDDKIKQFDPKVKGIRAMGDAFSERTQTWGEKKLAAGGISETSVWWIHAKVSEACAMWSLEDDSLTKYLIPASNFWLEQMVDHQFGEVHHMLDGTTGKPSYPKAHLWKSAYHSNEHALVLYIVSLAKAKQPVTLFFAPKGKTEDQKYHPYIFSGKVDGVSSTKFARLPEFTRVRVNFSEIGVIKPRE
jgi:hypothetical protein